jgi:hypothetical protein
MSKKILTNIDLAKNEIQNARVQNLATAPSSPVTGQLYYDTVANVLYFWNGSSWVSTTGIALGAGTPNTVASTTSSTGTSTSASHSDHTHGLTPGSFSLDQFNLAVAADISLNSHKITNLSTPVAATDAATKSYVDGVAQGLNVKASVVAASTANLTLSGTQTVDGIALVATNRVLVKNQTVVANNGIYLVSASLWTRSLDQTTPTQGDFTFVEQGTVNGSQGWILANGTTTWTQFSAAGEYTAGNGITIASNAITFNPLSAGGLQTASGGASVLLATNSGLSTTSGLAVGAGAGILVATGTVAIDTTVVVKKYAVAIGDGTSTSIVVTHNLGTQDVISVVYTATAPYDEVLCDVQHTSTTTSTLLFTVAPTTGQYRAVFHG